MAKVKNALRSLLAPFRPKPVIGLMGLPVASVASLIVPWLGLVKLGLAVGAFWWGYSVIWDRGYANRNAEYVAAMKASNAAIAELNAELEAAHASSETVRDAAVSSAVSGIPNMPECAKSQCALPAAAIARLNEVN